MNTKIRLAADPIGTDDLETVVCRMLKGVIGLDDDLKIRMCNPAAAMLDLERSGMLGRGFVHAVPHHQLRGVSDFVEHTCSSACISRPKP